MYLELRQTLANEFGSYHGNQCHCGGGGGDWQCQYGIACDLA